MKRFAWDSGQTSNFRKTWSGTPCFCTFFKIRFSGARERGIWGFQVWLLWCHAWLYIWRYIMYGFSIQNVSWHIYFDEESTTLGGDPTRRIGGLFRALPRRILLSFAPAAAAEWHLDRPTEGSARSIWHFFLMALSIAVVLFVTVLKNNYMKRLKSLRMMSVYFAHTSPRSQNMLIGKKYSHSSWVPAVTYL